MTEIAAGLASALSARYAIERELGAGGMATVYQAHDLKHDRKVAIKVLRPELAAAIGAERFLAEIRTTANLQHPHIIPLFDSGAFEDVLYFVMPYVDGESVQERIAHERRLPIADAVRIASEVARALDFAHRHGVIHRDIKPANILLLDGQALVADFGIALGNTSPAARITSVGMSIGTPNYMSPEQALGQRDIDARSDIYSLAATLYEMLTGAPPFTGESSQAIVAKVITEKPVPPSRGRADIPRHVESAILTALAKNPDDRMPSAGAFLAALGSGAPAARRRAPHRWWIAAGVAAVGFAAFFAARAGPADHAPRDGRPIATADTAAVRLVAQAENDFSRRDSTGCDRAIARYSEAIDKDSTFAMAYAGMAQARTVCTAFGYGRPRVELAAAKTAIEAALRLDSSTANAYTTRGWVHVAFDHDYPAAQRDFRTAIRLDSTQFTPWLYRAWYYLAMNQIDSAVASLRRAKALAPVSNVVGTRLATVLHFAGDNAAAEREVREVLARDPADINAHMELLKLDIEMGRCADARTQQRFLTHPPGYTAGVIAAADARCGNPAAAREFIAAQQARASTGQYVDNFAIAMAYAALGDSVGLVSALDQAVDDRYPLLFHLGVDPLFRPYRAYPPFRQLMQRARLP